MPHSFWLLAANGSRARLFAGGSPTGELIELKSFENPHNRALEQSLVSDRPGRRSDGGTHTSAHGTDHKDQIANQFAREIATYLDTARGSGSFDRLAIVAPPTFLGRLRKNLSNSVREAVLEEVHKDLVTEPAEKLQSHLTRLAP